MIYCKNIVDMKPVFYSSRDFEITFFFPFSAMPLSQLLKKKKLFPYFGNDIAVIAIFYFKSTPHSGTQHSGSKIGQRNFGIHFAEIQHFLSPPFTSSLSYFWLNFDNGNTEIHSLSSKHQITSNSSDNAN